MQLHTFANSNLNRIIISIIIRLIKEKFPDKNDNNYEIGNMVKDVRIGR
jgi:hypothetical protein